MLMSPREIAQDVIELVEREKLYCFPGNVRRALFEEIQDVIQRDRKETNMAIIRKIDLKHHIDEKGQIVKTGNSVPIPDDEPLILFRGRDHLAVKMLNFYYQLCHDDGCNDFQLGQVSELIKKFEKFAAEHPEVMKQPGVTRGL